MTKIDLVWVQQQQVMWEEKKANELLRSTKEVHTKAVPELSLEVKLRAETEMNSKVNS